MCLDNAAHGTVESARCIEQEQHNLGFLIGTANLPDNKGFGHRVDRSLPVYHPNGREVSFSRHPAADQKKDQQGQNSKDSAPHVSSLSGGGVLSISQHFKHLRPWPKSANVQSVNEMTPAATAARPGGES
ncbi:MAG: hypothetical protein Tsb0017_20290 [Geothermobacteraceae bacterium]